MPKKKSAPKQDASSHNSVSNDKEPSDPSEAGKSKEKRDTSPKNYWTRVMSLTHRPVDPSKKWLIGDDLKIEAGNSENLEFEDDGEFWPYFESKEWAKNRGELKIKDF